MRVLVSGSSGFIGTALAKSLQSSGHSVIRLVRGPPTSPEEISWDIGAGALDPHSLEHLDAVVHLAGAGIGERRWSNAHKAEIVDSRVQGTGLLARTLASLTQPPAVLISASAIGFYGDRGEETLTEESARGTGFLSDVAAAWEAAAGPAVDAGIRTVFARTGLVLAPGGGTLNQLLPLFKLGLGGPLGSGRQWWSWITLDDEVRAVVHCLESAQVGGPVNLTAPHPVRNTEFARTLGRALRRPAFLPAPGPALAIALGSERAHELVLASQRVVPTVLEQTGFSFAQATLDDAFGSVLS
jgi:uncharacterized protein (TIGR01777 family)